MKLQIRFAPLRELAALIELQGRASLVWDEYRDALLANPDAIQIPVEQFRNRQVRVAGHGDQPHGFSAVTALDAEIRELDGLFVAPTLWGRGIGGALIEDAARLARQRKFRWIEVTPNPLAEGFYAKLDFIKYAVTETRFGSAPECAAFCANERSRAASLRRGRPLQGCGCLAFTSASAPCR